MPTWYKADRTWLRITAHEVVSSSERFLTFATKNREYRVAKAGRWARWFPTYGEAVGFLEAICKQRVLQARRDLVGARANLKTTRQLRRAKPPVPTESTP